MIFSVEAVSYNMKTHDHMGKLSQVISLLLTEMKISSKCSGCRKALICWGSCDHPLCPPTKPGAVDLFWVIINHIMTWHYQYCHCLDIIVIGKVHQPVHLSKLPFIQILKILLLPPLMIIFVFIHYITFSWSLQIDLSCVRHSTLLEDFLQLGRNPNGDLPQLTFEQVSFNIIIIITRPKPPCGRQGLVG